MESQTTTSERRRSITKIFGKVKTAIQRGSRKSISSPSGQGGQPESLDKSTSTQPPSTAGAAGAAATTTTAISPEPTTTSMAPSIIEVDTDYVDDKTVKLLAKYNLDLVYDPPSRKVEPQERVSKPIKMRVRFTCHRCNTTFGHERECISCQHRRCSRCTRYPPKKAKKKQAAAPGAPEDAAQPSMAPDRQCACHMCQTDILQETQECPNCHHKICDQCLKEAQLEIAQPTTEVTDVAERPKPAGEEPEHTAHSTSEPTAS